MHAKREKTKPLSCNEGSRLIYDDKHKIFMMPYLMIILELTDDRVKYFQEIICVWFNSIYRMKDMNPRWRCPVYC